MFVLHTSNLRLMKLGGVKKKHFGGVNGVAPGWLQDGKSPRRRCRGMNQCKTKPEIYLIALVVIATLLQALGVLSIQ